MSRRLSVTALSLLAVCLALPSCSPRGRASQPSAVAEPARQFVALLAKGDFATAAASFDATMKQAMPPDKLGEAWGQLTAKLGAFQRQTGVRTATEQGYDVAYVTCAFASANADVKVVFDGAGQISGLWLLPSR